MKIVLLILLLIPILMFQSFIIIDTGKDLKKRKRENRDNRDNIVLRSNTPIRRSYDRRLHRSSYKTNK